MDYDLRKALQKVNDDPTSISSYHEFIPVAIETLQLDAAMQAAEAALEIDSLNHDSWLLTARVLEERGDFRGAIKIYEQQIYQNPDKAQYRYHLGLDLFSVGEFSAGLDNFKYRASTLGCASRPDYLSELRAKGGESVFFSEEQGLGDQIMFLQCLPFIEGRFSEVTVQIDQRLIPLYSRNFPDITFISRSESCDHKTITATFPLGDLFIAGLLPLLDNAFQLRPLALRNIDLESYKSTESKVRIGLSWRTSAEFGPLKRSIPLKALIEKLDPDLHKLVFLQYLPQPEDEELASNLGFEVEKPDDAFQNIYQVAQWILKCESVITIDNYIVHLSGALGAKTLALLPFSCSYRWALDNHICPIYKNVKLKRQTRVNEWAGIVDHSIYPWK